MAEYVQMGDAVDFVPAADMAAGDVVVLSDLVGVAKRAIQAGVLGALSLVGVYDFAKGAGAIPKGSRLYWDEAAKVATTSDGGGANKYLGKSVKDAADADGVVRARLSQ